MKFKLAHPSATLNITLEPDDIQDLIRRGTVCARKRDMDGLYNEIYERQEDGSYRSNHIQFLNINLVPYELGEPDDWHTCRYVNGKLEHDGTWEDGKWYEWLDKHDNIVIARMKMDAEDHFFPGTCIREEDVIAFREKSVKEKTNEES